MPVQLNGSAPYAPTTAITSILERNRNGGVPSPLTLQALERLSITESLRPRTLQALKLLDFIDDNGEPTSEFVNLRRLPTPEYKPKLAELLRQTYADVFSILDPSKASYVEVRDAFRGFSPAGQIDRMTALFLGLLEYTGEWDNLPSSRAAATPQPTRQRSSSDKRNRQRTAPEKDVGKSEPTGPEEPLTQERRHHSPSPVEDMRRAYFDLLVEKAKQGDADGALLDRIERLIGVASEPAQPDPRAAIASDQGGEL